MSSPRILVTDDSATIRNLIRRKLEKNGYIVETAKDGSVALTLLESFKPDLITLDLEMPGMTGFEVCERIRNRERDQESKKPLPVVFITAHDTFADRERGFELGAADFITKSAAQEEIVSRIEKVLTLAAPLKGLTALVVEDIDVSRMIVAQCLRQEGITVVEAENGAEAFRIMQEQGSTIDIVITDFLMPEMNGDELCQKIRTLLGFERLPIIFLSAIPEKEGILEIFRAGATDYLIKPFAKEELLARIQVHIEVHQLNRKLNEQVQELHSLNKLKDDFLAVASHDLRSPLNSIIGCADLLLEELDIGDKHFEFLNMISASGKHLLELIQELLELAWFEAQRKEMVLQPQPVVAILNDACVMFRQMAIAKNVRLDFENAFANAIPFIAGERSSLQRIFSNLISNAIKFTPSGGTVTVTIKALEEGDIYISVHDSGIGIPEKLLPELFNKFSKASRPGTAGEISTGLGLAITKQLVDRHFGRIKVESIEGQGTEFQLFFPESSQKGNPSERTKTFDAVDNSGL